MLRTFSIGFLRPIHCGLMLKSYPSNLIHYRYVDGAESELNDVSIEVLHGSCLGPLLFLLYVNAQPQAIQNPTIAMYADDTSLSYRSRAEMGKLRPAGHMRPAKCFFVARQKLLGSKNNFVYDIVLSFMTFSLTLSFS